MVEIRCAWSASVHWRSTSVLLLLLLRLAVEDFCQLSSSRLFMLLGYVALALLLFFTHDQKELSMGRHAHTSPIPASALLDSQSMLVSCRLNSNKNKGRRKYLRRHRSPGPEERNISRTASLNHDDQPPDAEGSGQTSRPQDAHDPQLLDLGHVK